MQTWFRSRPGPGFSPDDSLNAIFLSNYAYVSLVDPVKRVPGVGDVQVFGAGRYACLLYTSRCV